MEQEAIAVGAEHKRDIQRSSVVQALLHAAADTMVVVFGFDDRQWDVGFPRQQEVGILPFASFDGLAAYMYLARREVILFANLILNVPASRSDSRHNKLGADVAFTELLFIHEHESTNGV